MVKLNDKITELKKSMIIESASKYFQALGYEKTQIEKISKELSIGVGTIYSYFGSKEGLFYAWLDAIVDNAHKELEAKNVADPVKKLEWFVEYKLTYFQKHKATLKDYIYKNRLSPVKDNPQKKLHCYIADGIKELCPDKEDLYLSAHILDSIVNSYIECCDGDLLSKKGEIVEMFLRILNYEK